MRCDTSHIPRTSYPLITYLPNASLQHLRLDTRWPQETSAKVAAAKNIVIVGGGPVGVELAGEILEYYVGKKITLVHSGERLLESPYNRDSVVGVRKLPEMQPQTPWRREREDRKKGESDTQPHCVWTRVRVFERRSPAAPAQSPSCAAVSLAARPYACDKAHTRQHTPTSRTK
eukprot:359328-Chlamydomonas_euryale.AAC.10